MDYSPELIAIGKEVVERLCDENGYLDYYMDRDDYGALGSAEDLEALANYIVNENCTVEQAANYVFFELHSDIYDNIVDWMEYGEYGLFSQIRESIQDYDLENGTDLESEYDDISDTYEFSEACGYNGINIDCIDFFPSKLFLELELGTYEEWNHEGLINACFGDYNGEGDPTNPELTDNMLVQFLQSQGLTAMDVFDENKSGDVLDSVKRELVNISTNINFLTVCASFSLEGGAALLGKTCSSITIKPGSTIGLFDSWGGGGSIFEIKLGSAWTVPADKVIMVRISSNSKSGNYSVADVYGISADDDGWYKPTVDVN